MPSACRILTSVVPIILFGAATLVFLDGPPPGFTGGFGEPNCQQCHFGNALNHSSGRLELVGTENGFSAGDTLALSVRLSSQNLNVGGFQLSARSLSGESIGTWLSDDIRSSQIVDTTGVRYIEHTKYGTTPKSSSAQSIEWNVALKLPDSIPDSLVFNVAANAANGDNSALGDYIYTAEVTVSGISGD